MNFYSFLILIGCIISAFFTSNLKAQTFRVTSSHSNGYTTYIEVYEYDYVDQKPEFPGGGQSMLNFINEERIYPEEAYLQGIEGRVTCAFIINSDGSVSNISIIKGCEPSLNKEAKRIISKMPHWSPGKIDNIPVPVRVICSVPFRK